MSVGYRRHPLTLTLSPLGGEGTKFERSGLPSLPLPLEGEDRGEGVRAQRAS